MSTPGPSRRKMPRLEDDFSSDGDSEEMPLAVKVAINDVEKCQTELDSITAIQHELMEEIETKYNKLRKPCYDRRASEIEKIPNFWMTAVLNHPQIALLFEKEEERKCLKFLKKVEVDEFKGAVNGYRIKFLFDKNPYFSNVELVKEFQNGIDKEPESSSTEVKWKKNVDLEKKVKLNKMGFFTWFGDNEKADEDEIAELIKDDLWPNPLQYFKGEEDSEEELGLEEEEENGEESGEEEEEEKMDEESEDEKDMKDDGVEEEEEDDANGEEADIEEGED